MRYRLVVLTLSLFAGYPFPAAAGLSSRSVVPVMAATTSAFYTDTGAVAITIVPTKLNGELLRNYIAVKRALQGFWSSHTVLLETARAHALNPTVAVTSADGSQEEKHVWVFDYVTLTAHDSALAALFATCHLLPGQFAPTQVAVYQALYTLADNERPNHPIPTTDTTSVVGHNMVLVRPERSSLAEVGMTVSAPALVLGDSAPSLTVKQWVNSASGSTTSVFGDGHVYILAFTAHWCGPCRRTYPVLAKIPAAYGNRGVRVIYVTQLFGYYGDQQGLAPAAEVDSLKHYTVQHGFVGPVAVLPSVLTAGYEPADDFGFPFVVVIDGKGIVRAQFPGWNDDFPTTLPAAIDRVLAAKTTP